MKKIVMLLVILCFSAACTAEKKEKPPGIEGYVVKKESNSMLVVEQVLKEGSASHGAIWFSNADASIEAGEKVQVWFGAVAESYPAQAKAEKVKVIHSKKPENADLTEAEAVRRSLAMHSFPQMDVIAVIGAEFLQKRDQWLISLRHEETYQEIQVQVKDQ